MIWTNHIKLRMLCIAGSMYAGTLMWFYLWHLTRASLGAKKRELCMNCWPMYPLSHITCCLCILESHPWAPEKIPYLQNIFNVLLSKIKSCSAALLIIKTERWHTKGIGPGFLSYPFSPLCLHITLFGLTITRVFSAWVFEKQVSKLNSVLPNGALSVVQAKIGLLDHN